MCFLAIFCTAWSAHTDCARHLLTPRMIAAFDPTDHSHGVALPSFYVLARFVRCPLEKVLRMLDEGLSAACDHWRESIMHHKWSEPHRSKDAIAALAPSSSAATSEGAEGQPDVVSHGTNARGGGRLVHASPPMALLQHPVVAVLCNHILTAFNELRPCAPCAGRALKLNMSRTLYAFCPSKPKGAAERNNVLVLLTVMSSATRCSIVSPERLLLVCACSNRLQMVQRRRGVLAAQQARMALLAVRWPVRISTLSARASASISSHT